MRSIGWHGSPAPQMIEHTVWSLDSTAISSISRYLPVSHSMNFLQAAVAGGEVTIYIEVDEQ